jgi:hypothetical protein
MEDNYFQKSRNTHFWSYVFFIFSVLFLIFILSTTLFGLLFMQMVDESLDLRSQALMINKRADFNTYPFSQSFFKVQEPSRIELQINTYNHLVDGLELNLLIKADQGLLQESDLRISETRDQRLRLAYQNIQTTSCDPQYDCYLLSLILISDQPSQPFSSQNLSTSVANLNFIPQKEGSITLKLSQNSQINEHGSGKNLLQNVNSSEFNYYVSNNGIDFAQCRYVYGDWSECENFWQSRQYQVSPVNCHWYQQEPLEELTRQCSSAKSGIKLALADSKDFFLHYFTPCLKENSRGENFYLVWNTKQYPDFDWVDVSLNHRFENFYQQSTKTAQRIGDYAIMDLSQFTGFSQEIRGQNLIFSANQNYFFRLYNDQSEEFVYGPKLNIKYCTAELSQKLDCQDPCIETAQGSNCSEGLSCIDGSCRLASNPQSLWCFDEELISSGVILGRVAGATTQLSDSGIIIQGPFLPSEVYDISTYACNHGCNTNRDCMADYRCYEGRCRLASNPESPTCEEAVADDQQTSEDITTDEINVLVNQDDQENLSSESANLEDTTDSTETVDQEADNKKSESANNFAINLAFLNNLPSYFANLVNNIGFLNSFNWQFVALVGLLIIIAFVFIILGISRDPRRKKKEIVNKKKTELTKEREKAKKQEEIEKIEAELAKKENELAETEKAEIKEELEVEEKSVDSTNPENNELDL